VCVFPLDWISRLILMGTAPFIPLFMVLIGKQAEALNERHWKKITRLTYRFMDAIQGLVDLKLLNAGKREAEVVAAVSAEYGRTSLSVLRVAFLSALVLEFMATVSVAVVAVIIGFRLLWGQMSFESGFLILVLAPEFYLPLRSLGTYFHSRTEALSAAKHLTGFLQKDPVKSLPRGREMGFSRVELAFEKVSFSYEPGRQALKNLSFKALQTGMTCIKGPSGQGKSTVLKLAAGLLVPDSGRITANGVDLALIAPDSWRAHLAYLPQKPHLLSRSIAENIRLGNPDADLEKIKEAARAASVARDIEALPGGYSYVPGEDGQSLSGGQKQRIALARIFVRDCPVVLLDEPGTGLDWENRELLLRILRRLSGSRSVIITSHDPELAAAAGLTISL
ncbi:MAG: thiol reductant ABC exporter subunit CydD, partial [Desulfonatronovibrionaceae bacterium]